MTICGIVVYFLELQLVMKYLKITNVFTRYKPDFYTNFSLTLVNFRSLQIDNKCSVDTVGVRHENDQAVKTSAFF